MNAAGKLTFAKDITNVEIALLDGARLGHISQTTRSRADMRWYWEAAGRYDYCATREEAVAGITARIPDRLASLKADAEREAALDALPEPVRAAKIAEIHAKFEMDRAWGAGMFDSRRYDEAHRAWVAASVALLDAEAGQKAVA